MNMVVPKRQYGLSLVELMVAMALSLLLILGVVQIFLSSKQTYTTNNALSRLQESGRFALEFMAYDIRNAGYKGECVTPVNVLHPSTITIDERYMLDIGLQGWGPKASDPLPAWFGDDERHANTPALLIKHAASGTGASPAAASKKASLDTTSDTNIQTERIVVLSDPSGCDMFPNYAAPNSRIISSKSGDDGGDLGHTYSNVAPNKAQINYFESSMYFIKPSTQTNVPALWRAQYRKFEAAAAAPQELVEGIADMRLAYGLGTPNRQIDKYESDPTKITDWNNVLAVRITVLAVSTETNVVDVDQPSLDLDGQPIPDRRLGQIFTTTVGIRNRLP